MNRQYYVYMMTNKYQGVIYTGITNDLARRVYEHKSKANDGFTKKYRADRLVYYEICESIEGAIMREKQIKGGSRLKKIMLIEGANKEWRDLAENL